MKSTGIFSLPAISIAWYDPSSGTTINVRAAPAASEGIAPALSDGAAARRARRRLIKISIGTLLAVAAPVLAGWLLLRLLGRIRRLYERSLNSESICFWRVKRALDSRQAVASHGAIDAWLRRIGFRSIDDFVSVACDPDLAAGDFQRMLFGPQSTKDTSFDHGRLQRALTRGRKAVRLLSHSGNRSSSTLPALNAHVF